MCHLYLSNGTMCVYLRGFPYTDNVDYIEGIDMHASMERIHKISGFKRKKDIAEALGVSQSTVTNWGARGVSKEGALDAARIWNVDANYILEGDGEIDANSDEIPVASYKRHGQIPVLSPLVISDYSDTTDMERQPFEPSWTPKLDHLSNNAFVYIVGGSRMEPVFSMKDKLYIETEIEVADLADGNYVLIIKEGHTGPVVRKVMYGDNINQKFVTDINPNLPGATIDNIEDYRLIGIVDSQLIKHR